jgi:hypothetical protein
MLCVVINHLLSALSRIYERRMVTKSSKASQLQISSPMQPTPKRRRRWRWKIAFVFLLLLGGGGWFFINWFFSTNQPGIIVSKLFNNRLPGHLHIGRTEFNGLEMLTLSDIQLMSAIGEKPAVVADRVMVLGALWKGEIEKIRVENCRLHATVDVVHFLHHLIKTELSIPPKGPPSLIHLEFTGGILVNGLNVVDQAFVSVEAIGPLFTLSGNALYDGKPFSLAIATDGVGESRQYRITQIEGILPVWRSCDWLADLDLLPRLPHEARPWIPEFADTAGTVVIADKTWDHFTGEAKAKWKEGRGQGQLNITSKRVKLDQVIVRDDGLGQLNGSADIDTVNNIARISATTWAPGPRIPLPDVIPTKIILAAMPKAQLVATAVTEGWKLAFTITSNDGSGQATLTWGPDWPLAISGSGIKLPLLQAFVPGAISLAAGNATALHAVVTNKGLQDFSATIEQARILWAGWALGSTNARIDVRLPPSGGIDLRASAPGIGTLRFQGDGVKSHFETDITNAEALVVRLKGPEALPDLSGSIALKTDVITSGDTTRLDIEQLNLRSVGITDVIRNFNTNVQGAVTFYPQRIGVHVLGRLVEGDIRLPGSWHNLARRRPIFNAQLSVSNSILLAENILVRATDDNGNAKIDGFSAGLRGRISLKEQQGTVIGVVDHADLEWLNTFMPIKTGLVEGECAVTFNAELDNKGVRSIDGHFLPLDADVNLPGMFTATGIKGSVQFRINRSAAKKP